MRLWQTPCIRRQLGLARCFGEELFHGEAVLEGHLREQQAAAGSLTDEQSVDAELDFLGTDGEWGGEYRNFNVQAGQLLGTQSGKTRIAHRGPGRAGNDGVAQRFWRVYNADAAAESRADVEADEDSTGTRKNACGWNVRPDLPA